MTQNTETLAALAGVHLRIADDVTRDGCGWLRCEACGVRRKPDTEGIAGYFANGWPAHCGETMRWWAHRQVEAGEMPPFRVQR
jgi:hypothetical protein